MIDYEPDNLKRYKTAQIIPADGYADGGEPYDDEEMELMNVKCPTCQGEGKFMGMLGDLLHFRCLQCGMEFNKPTEFDGKSMPVQTDLEDQTGRSPRNPRPDSGAARGPIPRRRGR
jgi:ribosomal protein S27AE